MEQAEAKERNEKKRAELEIRKAKIEVKVGIEKMRDIEYFWGMGYITVIFQDSGNRSCAFYFGSCHENNRGSNKPIQKNVG